MQFFPAKSPERQLDSTQLFSRSVEWFFLRFSWQYNYLKVQNRRCKRKVSCISSNLQIKPSIMVVIFWDFLIFDQIFLSPQVKRTASISNKHAIYELPHKLPNDLRLGIVGNYDISGKSQNFIELYPSAQSSSKNESFLNTSKSTWKIEIELFPWCPISSQFVSNILWVIVAAWLKKEAEKIKNSWFVDLRSRITIIRSSKF